MKTAREIMAKPLTVRPDLPVKELACALLDQGLDGACVIDDQGHLVGVVTAMDLIYQEKRVHLPTFFMLFDSVLSLDRPGRAEEELHKIAGSTVADVMTANPVTVSPDTALDEIASLMVEQHLSVVPVTEAGRLVGAVRKPAMLREAFDLETDEQA